MKIIYIWSDGTWCYEDEIWQYSHMSDDYETSEIDENISTKTIEQFVKGWLLLNKS